jgi:hypothetical protein
LGALAILLSLCQAATMRAQLPLGNDWYRSDDPGERVLEMVHAGGYGNGTSEKWVFYGDGRLEEFRLHQSRGLSEGVARPLPVPPGTLDKLLHGLVTSGVAGMTQDDLLQATQSVHLWVESFVYAPDCAHTRLSLNLLHRVAGSHDLCTDTTKVWLTCISSAPRLYPGVQPIEAIMDVYLTLTSASIGARPEQAPASAASPSRGSD